MKLNRTLNLTKKANNIMNKLQAIECFKESHGSEFIRQCQKTDKPQLREAWNNFTDGLCKSGQITMRQYETWTHPKFIK